MAIDEAITAFGPDNLTGENIIKGAEMIKERDKGLYGHPLVTPPVTFTADKHYGADVIDVIHVENGKIVLAPEGGNIPVRNIIFK